jgi:hypothetical protein
VWVLAGTLSSIFENSGYSAQVRNRYRQRSKTPCSAADDALHISALLVFWHHVAHLAGE